MSSTKPDKKFETRTRILDATWTLMEQQHGQGVSMSNIAKQAGISRQALYLHFDSRIDLVVATVNYVDEVKGLSERLKKFEQATSGIEMLDAYVEVWGNYIPEIYGLAKAMLNTRATDVATATAWNGCMTSLRKFCQQTIKTLDAEAKLADDWSQQEAVEMFWTMISIQQWEQLTLECGWSTEQYITRMKKSLKSLFVSKELTC